MRYTNLFFDLDRTLWDYDANSARALTEIFTAYKLQRYFTSAEDLEVDIKGAMSYGIDAAWFNPATTTTSFTPTYTICDLKELTRLL